MAAVTDIGFANALMKALSEQGAGYVRAGCRDDRAETGKGGAPQRRLRPSRAAGGMTKEDWCMSMIKYKNT